MLISFVRTLLLFAFVALTLRLLGKRQVGELEPAELVVTILISELVAIPMQDLSVPLLAGVIPLLTVVAVDMLISHLLLKSVKLRKLVAGRPSILIVHGKFNKPELKRNRVSLDEVIETLRIKDITDPATVQYAILETNGQLSTVLYPEHRPLTPENRNENERSGGLPVIVISDGRWLDDNLSLLSLTRAWAEEQARERGARGVKDVFLMMVDEQRRVYLQTQHEQLRGAA